MRNTIVRRSVMTASAVSLVLLAAACSSDKPADKKAEPRAAGSSSAPAAAPEAKGKTDAELAKLIVTQADVRDRMFKEVTAAEIAAASTVTSDKPECKVLAQAQSLGTVGTPTGAARTKVSTPESAGVASLGLTALTLTSYDGKGAEEALASVKTAGTACAGGYTVPQAEEKITKVAPGPAVTGVDDTVTLTLSSDDLDTQLVVVRKGNTLATSYTVGLKPELALDVLDVQFNKLG
ncbi:hypothetical protein ACIPYQ_40495 [Streptomyces sp. NPDC090045]|uniref:hypothetical protein n=1 Tax=Streptomyces sp. NPDC090045 TaxID=3365927 RepID=UPI0037FCC28E